MSGTLPPFHEVTPENRGPIVVVIGLVFVFISILLTVVRTVLVVLLKRGWFWDDACVVAGTILALVQTILSERAVKSGLGRHVAKLDAADIDSYYKFTYANQVLAVPVMALAKISVLLLMLRLSPQRRLRQASHMTIIAVTFWAVFSVLTLALQCGLPDPWVYSTDKCSIRGALWYPVVILNILTDLAVAVLFIPVILRLQMPLDRQLTVCLLFGSRLIVCAVGIAQLSILPSALDASDQTWDTLTLAVLIQVIMTLSIITAVIPSLCRFFSELQIGHGARLPESHSDIGDQSYDRMYALSHLPRHKGQNRNCDAATSPDRWDISGNFEDRTHVDNGMRGPVSTDAKMLRRSNGVDEAEDATEISTQWSDHSRAELNP